jgi:hypothetical protein
MNKLILVFLILGLLCLPLMAQDDPKAEVFGGYQFLRLSNLGSTGYNLNTNGWDASATGNFNKYLGITGDFSGAYKSTTGTVSGSFAGVSGTLTGTAHFHLYSYTFGPVLSLHAGRLTPFAHGLFGGAHASLSGCGTATTAGGTGSGCASGSRNGFAMMYGGGLDVKADKLISIRLAQVDWAYYHFSGMGFSKNVRVSTGIVFTF